MFLRVALGFIAVMQAPSAASECVRLHVAPSAIEADSGVFEVIIEGDPSCALAPDETLLLRVKRPGGEELIYTTMESWLAVHELEPGERAGVLGLEVELDRTLLAARTILVVAAEAENFNVEASKGSLQNGLLLTVDGARDAFGNDLPDGTIVEFAVTSNAVPITLRQIPLMNGRARADFEPSAIPASSTIRVRVGNSVRYLSPGRSPVARPVG